MPAEAQRSFPTIDNVRYVIATVLGIDGVSVPFDPTTPLMSEGLCKDDLDVVEITMAAEELFETDVDLEFEFDVRDGRGNTQYSRLTLGGLTELLSKRKSYYVDELSSKNLDNSTAHSS